MSEALESEPEPLSAWSEDRGPYSIRFANSAEDRHQVQTLRFDVFSRELGATVEGADQELDRDPLDDCTDHLMVLDRESGECVGGYRLATLDQVGHVPGFYTQRIFDMTSLGHEVLKEGVELGRACVAIQHRTRGVFHLLLRGIGAYLLRKEKRFLFGCGSVPLKESGQAAATRALIENQGWLDPALGVAPTPRYVPDFSSPTNGAGPEIPALLYAYCAIGARLAPSPAYDPDFRTLDFFVLLDLERVNPRVYARYCLPR